MGLQTEIRGKQQQQQQQQMDNLEQRFVTLEDRVAERFAALESKLNAHNTPQASPEEGIVGILGGWEKDTKSSCIDKWIKDNLAEELKNALEWFVPPPKSKVAIVRFRTKSDLYECIRRIRPKSHLHPTGKLYLFQSQPEEVREERTRLSSMMKRLRDHLPTNREWEVTLKHKWGVIWLEDDRVVERNDEGRYIIHGCVLRKYLDETVAAAAEVALQRTRDRM
eukprot:6469818-Amphidinium_carterae.1